MNFTDDELEVIHMALIEMSRGRRNRYVNLAIALENRIYDYLKSAGYMANDEIITMAPEEENA